VYDTAKSRVATHFTPIRTNRSRVSGYDPVTSISHQQQHLLDRGGFSGIGGVAGIRPQYNNYPDYEYSTPGEASPYSVSSELYKHVLPQYYKYGNDPNNSVLV
jgi:hypothetical protein